MMPRRGPRDDALVACSCGEVKVALRGASSWIGVCHSTDCRQEIGSAFTVFAVWPASEFETRGGSRLFSVNEHDAEIKLGILSEAPTPLKPKYERWVKRRENWLAPIEGAEQLTRIEREGSQRAVLTASLDTGSCGSSDFARGQERSVETPAAVVFGHPPRPNIAKEAA